MHLIFDSFEQELSERDKVGIKRNLKISSIGIDFYSNDYLGFAKNKELHEQILNEYNANISLLFGSTGARLISGNSALIHTIEKYIANEHNTEAALFFPSGYNANLALFSAILKRNDTIIVDEKIHRSVHDGCRLSFAKKLKFKHNDINHLEDLLQKVNGRCFIAVESLYSMDGDLAPLEEICQLSKKYNAALIVDEAHAFGTFGFGLIHQLGLQNDVFATVVTYGKAMGMNGAVVLSKQLVIDYLVNFASPFIYTTASSNAHISEIKIGYEYLKKNKQFVRNLLDNLTYFHSKGISTTSDKQSPIQILQFNDTDKLRKIQKELEVNQLQTFAVFSPTVKQGEERLRICIHAFNTHQEIDQLIEIIKQND